MVDLKPLPADARMLLCERLGHCFDKMFEAVAYRLDGLAERDVRHFDLIPVAEYQTIRIFLSDLDKMRLLLSGNGPTVAYVSFIGNHRPGVTDAVEATDRALIGKSPRDADILGYLSLQDPQLAWVNLVLFDDMDTIDRWVAATAHAEDWKLAASYFTSIEKSLGFLDYNSAGTSLQPMRLVTRDYELPRD